MGNTVKTQELKENTEKSRGVVRNVFYRLYTKAKFHTIKSEDRPEYIAGMFEKDVAIAKKLLSRIENTNMREEIMAIAVEQYSLHKQENQKMPLSELLQKQGIHEIHKDSCFVEALKEEDTCVLMLRDSITYEDLYHFAGQKQKTDMTIIEYLEILRQKSYNPEKALQVVAKRLAKNTSLYGQILNLPSFMKCVEPEQLLLIPEYTQSEASKYLESSKERLVEIEGSISECKDSKDYSEYLSLLGKNSIEEIMRYLVDGGQENEIETQYLLELRNYEKRLKKDPEFMKYLQLVKDKNNTKKSIVYLTEYRPEELEKKIQQIQQIEKERMKNIEEEENEK